MPDFLIIPWPLFDIVGDIVGGCSLIQELDSHLAQFLELLYHRRDDEPHHQCDNGNDGKHGDDDGKDARGYMCLFLEEFYHWVKKVRQKPGYEKRQEHST